MAWPPGLQTLAVSLITSSMFGMSNEHNQSNAQSNTPEENGSHLASPTTTFKLLPFVLCLEAAIFAISLLKSTEITSAPATFSSLDKMPSPHAISKTFFLAHD